MASYTGHGHHIPGTDLKTPPKQVAKCGGIGICLPCSSDYMRQLDGARMLFSNPAGVSQERASSLMSTEPNQVTVPDSVPNVPSDHVFNKAINALHSIGHSMETAEQAVVHLLKSGIVLRDVNQADADVAEVKKVVDEAAPVLEAAEPTLAPEAESVQTDVDKAAAVEGTASTDAKEFINEVNPPSAG